MVILMSKSLQRQIQIRNQNNVNTYSWKEKVCRAIYHSEGHTQAILSTASQAFVNSTFRWWVTHGWNQGIIHEEVKIPWIFIVQNKVPLYVLVSQSYTGGNEQQCLSLTDLFLCCCFLLVGACVGWQSNCHTHNPIHPYMPIYTTHYTPTLSLNFILMKCIHLTWTFVHVDCCCLSLSQACNKK